MKAILAFDLPEDQCEFEIASTAMKWALTIYDLDNDLRERLKYRELPKPLYIELEDIREFLSQTLEKRNLSLDMIK